MNSDPIVPQDNKITAVKDSLPSSYTKLQQQKEEIMEKIPIYEEEFSINKELTETQLYLEKKWMQSTKKIEIPINYEEMFINGKEFNSYSQNELAEVFSKIKEKISEVIHHNQNEGDKPNEGNLHYPNDLEIKHQKEENETIPPENEAKYNNAKSNMKEKTLSLQSTEANKEKNQIQITNNGNVIEGEEEEKIIPIWGEQIIIDKKMVKLGEIVIKKFKISKIHKLDVEVRKEKVTVKYPDGNKEEII